MKTWLGLLLEDLGKLVGKGLEWVKEVVLDPDLFFPMFFVTLFVGAGALGLGALYMHISSDDKIKYCTVERAWADGYSTREQYFRVVGHKEWRSDVVVADMPRLDWAIDLAETGACNQ